METLKSESVAGLSISSLAAFLFQCLNTWEPKLGQLTLGFQMGDCLALSLFWSGGGGS